MAGDKMPGRELPLILVELEIRKAVSVSLCTYTANLGYPLTLLWTRKDFSTAIEELVEATVAKVQARVSARAVAHDHQMKNNEQN